MARRRARSPEARENELIAMAYDLAEQRIREGTASAMEITHFLKLGSSKGRREIELLSEEIKLANAKTKAYESSEKQEQLYLDALNAMKIYTGRGEEVDDNDEEDIR